MIYDVLVIGAGIVGVATARQLLLDEPTRRVLLIDKEKRAAQHQTGHNSGVIHAGVYYPPGSLKAQLCRAGARATRAFCEQQNIAVDPCGKLIVATSELEQERLVQLQQRCVDNGLKATYLSASALQKREPRLQGLAAIHVPDTAVVNFSEVCEALLNDFRRRGGLVNLDNEVTVIEERDRDVRVKTQRAEYRATKVICCAGLMSDRLARLSGLDCPYRIIPFRGEFYQLHERCHRWFRHLVYPVPDPDLPFLGVHLTRTPAGGVIAGPNALLGLARESYRRRDICWEDVQDMLRFPGFWRLLQHHGRAGWKEALQALSRQRYVQQLQAYCPDLESTDLLQRFAGVRAQAVGRNGELIQDFLFIRSKNILHVLNAPSPAATSALPIACHIVEQLQS